MRLLAGFRGAHTNRDDTRGELPCCSASVMSVVARVALPKLKIVLEGVRYPVGEKARYSPLSIVPGNRVQIFIRPGGRQRILFSI